MTRKKRVEDAQIPERMKDLAPGDQVRAASGATGSFARWDTLEGQTVALIKNPGRDRSYMAVTPDKLERV